ncbi:diguanylate cyclase/phosphodiesterase with PAS/PAC sensor(s) [Ureibacillus xyleni]|uniref:Diguanylate cyclase/phosphodiesterase with PAS/PAC sensor(S) n=1 Tax=Ureibacillus xyleni TaxID=614648 RepID=A0A285S3Q2_9BACL|nr:EAL domain-containing protein [Ureibacillus xyleni]SOB99554.1 diguanylate cyclase/phosphodiesterase with PAS/PAC sensor(s) [Ureibacillus xyleni]
MKDYLSNIDFVYQLFNKQSDSIVVLNKLRNILYVNPKARELFELNNNVVGQSINTLLLDFLNSNGNQIYTAVNKTKNSFKVEINIEHLHIDDNTYEILFIKNVDGNKQSLELNEKKIKFFDMMSNIQNGIFCMEKNEKGQFIYTMAVGKLLNEIGASFDTLRDKSPSDVFPNDIAIIKEEHYKKAFEGQHTTYEINLNNKLVYVDVTPVLNGEEVTGIVGTVLDISELRTTQQELQINEERFQSLFKYSQDYIIMLNTNSEIINMNPSTLEFLGLSSNSITSIRLFDIIPESYQGQVKMHFEQATQGYAQNFELGYNCDNGKEVYFNVTLFPIIINSNIQGVYLVAKDINEQKQIQLKNAYLAQHDELTDLPNRRWMESKINESLQYAKQHKKKLAVLYLDLDRFKSINDTLGHYIGDRLLKQFAERLVNCIGENHVSRMGGDEFMVLIPDTTSESEVTEIANAILKSLTDPFYIDDFELFITTSIGISMFPIIGNDDVDLMKKADIALYKAKELGRNMYQMYDASMNVKNYQSLILERDLRKAILNEEFIAYFQPRVDARTGKVTSAEALIRWNHPQVGLISPLEFIPLAEETGLIIPMGKWMKKRVCEQLVTWREAGLPLVPISVNISSQRFLQKNFAMEIRELLEEYKLEGKYLEIEITENSIMKNEETVTKTLRELKELGVKIYIDDFGTGYSSFNYLKTFHLDGVKIDRSFIQNISSESENASITTAMIKMAQHLKLDVIAEGVETEGELSYLLEQNCNEMQGYYFGRPCPIDEFENKYLKG